MSARGDFGYRASQRGSTRPRRTPPAPPYCKSGPQWIVERLKDKHALAPLTGQDWRALKAFLHLVDLYGSSDDIGQRCAVLGMLACVSAMQPTVRHIAKAGIPHVLDWSHEAEIWARIENIADDVRIGARADLAGVGR